MSVPNSGVINPLAMAEFIEGKKIDWHGDNPPWKKIGEVLGMPISKLLNPAAGSPIYAGLEVSPTGVKYRSPFEDLSPLDNDSALKHLRQGKIHGLSATWVSSLPEEKQLRLLSLFRPTMESFSPPFIPPGPYKWMDKGDFYGPSKKELTDPVQGAVGDCYFIAALCSVVWVKSSRITRTTVSTNPDKDKIKFYAGSSSQYITCSEKVPVTLDTESIIYARSHEGGEIWPSVYEKAYAKWIGGTTTDCPDYSKIHGGSAAGALTQLTGVANQSYATNNGAPHNVTAQIMMRCDPVSGKTIIPITAGTFAEGNDYGDTNGIYAWHAYSVLGWMMENSTFYIILRNPWGFAGAAKYLPVANKWTIKTVDPNDIETEIELNKHGIFGLREDKFNKWFVGIDYTKSNI